MKLLNFSQLPIGAQILAKKNVQASIFWEGSKIRELLIMRIRGSVESFGLPAARLALLAVNSFDFEVVIAGEVNIANLIKCNSKAFRSLPESLMNKIELGSVTAMISSTPVPGPAGFTASVDCEVLGLPDMKEALLLKGIVENIVEIAKTDAYARTAKNILTVCERAGRVFDITGSVKVGFGKDVE